MIHSEIHINGSGGLGNVLFHIAVGIYYKEKYNCSLILNSSSHNLNWGTSTHTKRRKTRRDTNGNPISYINTIFNNPNLFFKDLYPFSSEQAYPFHYNNIQYNVVHNDFTANKIVPNDNDTYIKIAGHNQNLDLFIEVKDKLLSYFNFEDKDILNYISTKYHLDPNKKNIMLGLRLDDDFLSWNKINSNSYKNALYSIVDENDSDYNLIVLSDLHDGWKNTLNFPIKGNVIFVEEDDITQFYVGLLCNYFILCESTFHYWIALFKFLKDPSTTVCVFNDTDFTNKNLSLPEWKRIEL